MTLDLFLLLLGTCRLATIACKGSRSDRILEDFFLSQMGSANTARTSSKLSPDDETGHASIFCSMSCEDSAAKVIFKILPAELKDFLFLLRVEEKVWK